MARRACEYLYMATISLHELISALSGAVVQAQDAIQQHQLLLLGQFFDDTGAPKSVTITVPNLSRDRDESPTTQLSVPRISLVEATLLQITEFEVSFDVELGDLNTEGQAGTPESSNGLDHEGPSTDPELSHSQAVGPSTSGTSDPSATTASVPGTPAAALAGSALSRTSLFGGAPGSWPNSVAASASGASALGSAAQRTMDLGSESAAREKSAAAAMAEIAPQMDVALGPKSPSVATAKATLKVSAKPMSDGMVRLLNHLNKTF